MTCPPALVLTLALTLSCVPAAAQEQAGGELEVGFVDYDHEGTVCEGYLAFDPAIKGKRPGVLVCHAWRGQDEFVRERCRELAASGYVAFALDVYGKGVRAENNDEARELAGKYRGDDRTMMRGRAAAALQVLAAHEHVDAGRLAAIGYCFGGTTALELARSGAALAATVSFHGGLNTPAPADARNIRGQVLVLHGAADSAVDDAEVDAFCEEMKAAGVDWQLNVYADAEHGFSEPGRSRYQKQAAERSWRAMLACFDEVFGQGGAAPQQPEPAPRIAYLEIVTPGVDATCAALERMLAASFGEPVAELGQARTATLADGGMIGVRAPMRETEPPVVRPYWHVDDIAAALKEAEAAGAEIAHPPLEIPGHCTFAIIIQNGIQHGLWQP